MCTTNTLTIITISIAFRSPRKRLAKWLLDVAAEKIEKRTYYDSIKMTYCIKGIC